MKRYSSVLCALLILFPLFLGLANLNNAYAQTNAWSTDSATPPSNELKIKRQNNVDLIGKNSVGSMEKSHAQQNITIIESQSANIGHVMDDVWASVAGSMGHTATILPQSTLDNNSFFATTDILIVSSGVIDLPLNRVNTIIEFLRSGGPVYLQNEYQCTYSSNLAFQTIVDSLSGVFSTTGTVSGDLVPMNVFGILSSNSNPVDSLGYFWYGCAGVGDSITVIPFLEYTSQYFGFIFDPPNPAFGKVVTTSDQDWIRQALTPHADAIALMENILAYLSGASVGIDEPSLTAPQQYILFQNFPNPFNPSTAIRYRTLEPGNVELKIFNGLGQDVSTLVDKWQNVGSYDVVWEGTDKSGAAMPSGTYFYRLRVNDFIATNRMLLLK